MKKKVITIDEEKCIGCGLCAGICHEGVIEIIDGKAKVVRENNCDGIGNCLPNCPTDALKLVEKEISVCNPITMTRWPIQLKLVSDLPNTFKKEELVIAADCTAFTYKNFFQECNKDDQLIIACPKLDGTDYSEKIKNIILNNNIRTVKLLRMEVPCCGGLEMMLKKALSDIDYKVEVVTKVIKINGELS